jgi:hypothetical protein
MARTGRFGRLPGPGFDYSSIVGSLLAQYENARNANILSAWRDGGMFEGKKVTDARLLAWFKSRRNEYDKDDPEWDKWNQQITQFKYDIAEQKMMLEYTRQNIGEGAVARWYTASAAQFPRNSQAWRDAMINAARYRRAAQEKAAAAARANAPSRTDLYNGEMNEVTRTHIKPANFAIKWWGDVLQGAGITNGGSWDSATIDALSGGHQEALDWLQSEEPRAVALRKQYRDRYGVDYSTNHFRGVIKRGAKGSEMQVGISRKYKYHGNITKLRENKAYYNRNARRARLAKEDRWTDYIETQTDAEEALKESQSPEETAKILADLSKELAPIKRYFETHGEKDAAYLVGETIDAAEGGEVSTSVSLGGAPWGQQGTDEGLDFTIDPETNQPVQVTNDFNVTLLRNATQAASDMEGLRDGSLIRVRQPETGDIITVPREQFPDIASSHFLDNVLDVTAGVTIAGKKYPARSNAAYIAWVPGSVSVSDPDDPFTTHTFVPDGINEFAVAETIDGELVYRYSTPSGKLYTGPIPPFDERIEVFGHQNGTIKVSGVQVRELDPTFLRVNNGTESGAFVTQRAQETLGMGAGSRSPVFKSSGQQEFDEEGNPIEPAEPVRERTEVADTAIVRLVEQRDAAREELASAEKKVGLLQRGKRLDDAKANLEMYESLLAGYKATPEGSRQLVLAELEAAEAAVRAFYDGDEERWGESEVSGSARELGALTTGAGATATRKPSEEFLAALDKRDALVEQARAAGIDVQVDTQEFALTFGDAGLTISTAVRTSVPEGAVNPPAPLVDKPPVYSPMLTQDDNPLASVLASESQWGKLSTITPHDAKVVFDAMVAANEWQDDGAAQARLAYSFQAAFMAGSAGDTHLEWMKNYPGSSMGEAIEMSSRITYFRQRREELDDSGIDFWEGVDNGDLLRLRKDLIATNPAITGDDIDREYPWLASARQPDEPSEAPPPPTLADVRWAPVTDDLSTDRSVRPKASRGVTANDLMAQNPAALQAAASSPPPSTGTMPDFDFPTLDTAVPNPADYQSARPSWVQPPMPTMTVPAPAAFDITKPIPPPVVAQSVSTRPAAVTSIPRVTNNPIVSSGPRML